jgi:4-amino-4-deoxy-L-arabinose transferase-like glycosyltransferase
MRWVWAVVLVAFVVRLAVVVATPHFVAVTDASEFDYDAVSLVHHGALPSSGLTARGGPTAFRPPLFPLALAGVYKVVGTGSAKSRWEAGRIMEAVLGAVAVGLICLIALRLWGLRVGIAAGALAAIYPPLVLAGSSLLSESLFIPLELGAVLSALAHRDSPHRWRWAIASGVLAGLAALTRGNGVALALPLVFLVWSERPRRTWHSLRAPAAMLAACVLTIAPWAIRNQIVLHQFVPVTTETGFALAGTYNWAAQHDHAYPDLWLPPVTQLHTIFAAHPTANEAQVSSHLTTMALHYVRAHPGSVPATVYWNTVRLLNLTGSGVERAFAGGEGYPVWLAVASVYAFWVLLALALVGAIRGAARRAPLALWACPLVIVLTTVPLLGLTRYRAPIDPFLLPLAAAALLALWPARASAQPVSA